MQLKIVVCDDVLAEREYLITLINQECPSYDAYVYDRGENLLFDMHQGSSFDVYLLDIYMHGINGIDVAQQIIAMQPNAIIVFISSSEEFYRESYDLYAFNYLIKPVKREVLVDVLSRASKQLTVDNEQVLHVSFDKQTFTIRHDDLLYLSSDRHRVNFYLKNNKVITTYGKINDFIDVLPSRLFIRTHQSFMVNLSHISSATSTEFMVDDTPIPVSKKYSEEALKQYRKQIFRDF